MSELLQQLFNGLVSGSFYAMLALGLAVIFGMLGVVNFAHGACYMLGAFGAFVLLDTAGLSWWLALLIVPVVLGVFGMVVERLLVARLVRLDPLYNFLLTFGIALIGKPREEALLVVLAAAIEQQRGSFPEPRFLPSVED